MIENVTEMHVTLERTQERRIAERKKTSEKIKRHGEEMRDGLMGSERRRQAAEMAKESRRAR